MPRTIPEKVTLGEFNRDELETIKGGVHYFIMHGQERYRDMCANKLKFDAAELCADEVLVPLWKKLRSKLEDRSGRSKFKLNVKTAEALALFSHLNETIFDDHFAENLSNRLCSAIHKEIQA